MTYGPIDLTGANWGMLRFSFWLETELYNDMLNWLISIDNLDFYGSSASGSTEGQWIEHTIDLINFDPLGNVMNHPQLWISFWFQSNESITKRGAFIDDITLELAQLDTLDLVNSYPVPGTSGRGLTWDGSNLWHSDNALDKLFKLDPDCNVLESYNSPGNNPADLAWDGSSLWIADSAHKIFSLRMFLTGVGNANPDLPVQSPCGLTFEGANIWISDFEASNYLFESNPAFDQIDSIKFGNDFSSQIAGLAWEEPYLWLADWKNSIIYKTVPAEDSINFISSFFAPSSPRGLTHDGFHLWCVSGDSIFKLNPPKLILRINQIFSDSFPVIRSLVSVIDQNGSPIEGLELNNFNAKEDGNDQYIQSVIPHGGGHRVSVSLALDYSGSMGSAGISDLQDAAHGFIDLLQTNDQAAIFKFKGDIWKAQGLTGDKELLRAAIDAPFPYQSSNTALYDAIYAAVDELKIVEGRKAAIAITDGQDNISTNKLYDTINYAKMLGVPVFTIGMGNSINEDSLKIIAEQTNGSYYYAPTSSQLSEIYANISNVLSNQYEITYSTINTVLDGTKRRVDFFVNKIDLNGHNSTNYYAPPPGPGGPVYVMIGRFLSYRGDTLEIPIHISSGDSIHSPIYSCDFCISFNTGVLNAIDFIKENCLSQNWDVIHYISSGQINVAMSGHQPLSNEGILGKININVVGLPGDTCFLHFNSFIFNEGAPQAVTEDGFIKIRDEFNVSGRIGYYSDFIGKPVMNTCLQLLVNNLSDTLFILTTDSSGSFHNTSVPTDTIILKPKKADDIKNAISSYDASLILRDSVGLLSLTPLQMIAADVSGNGAVSGFDASYIMRYVVGMIDSLPIGKDWTFIPRDFEVTQANWAHAPQEIPYEPLEEDKFDQNFVGIVYGDVSGNWSAQNYNLVKENNEIDNQVDEVIIIQQSDDDIFILNLGLKNYVEIYSVDLAMKFPSQILQYLDTRITANSGDINYLEKLTDEGLKLSLCSAEPFKIDESSIVEIKFRIQKSEKPLNAESIEITRLIVNESMTENFRLQLVLNESQHVPTDYFLYSNYPNPFNSQTIIKYDLPEKAKVKLEIYNLLGQKVIVLTNEEKQAGSYQIFWNGTHELGQVVPSGIYLINFQANKYRKNSRMILLK